MACSNCVCVLFVWVFIVYLDRTLFDESDRESEKRKYVSVPQALYFYWLGVGERGGWCFENHLSWYALCEGLLHGTDCLAFSFLIDLFRVYRVGFRMLTFTKAFFFFLTDAQRFLCTLEKTIF